MTTQQHARSEDDLYTCINDHADCATKTGGQCTVGTKTTRTELRGQLRGLELRESKMSTSRSFATEPGVGAYRALTSFRETAQYNLDEISKFLELFDSDEMDEEAWANPMAHSNAVRMMLDTSNRISARAAQLVAGLMNDTDRAILIAETKAREIESAAQAAEANEAEQEGSF